MTLIDRYIGRTITGTSVLVLLFLVVSFTFFTFIDELNDVGRGAYGLGAAVLYVLLRLPGLTYQLFPIAALVGSLIALSTMVSQSEIVAIRVAGVSLGRVMVAVLRAGVVLMVVAMAIGEFAAPPAEQQARELRSIAMFDEISLKTRNGFWARDGDSFINIRKVLPGDRIEDIYIYEFDKEKHLRTSTHADAAQYDGKRWMLRDIEQSAFGEDKIDIRHIARAAWESLLRPELIGIVVINPGSLSMWDLVSYVSYLRQNGQNTLRYEQALWTKIAYPLATAAMVFLAVPMVFATPRSTNLGSRVLLGSLIGLTFHIGNQAAANLGVVYDLNPALCVFTPTLLIIIAGFALLRRVR